MSVITVDELIRLMKNQPKSKLDVVLHTETQPKLNKKHRLTKEPCPFSKGVSHHAAREIVLCPSYEDEVNAARLRELKISYFVAKPMWANFGEHVNELVIKHKNTGELYLCYQEKLDEDGKVKLVGEDFYLDLANAVKLDFKESELEQYLPPRNIETILDRQKVKERNRIEWRTTKLVNVKGIEIPHYTAQGELLQLTI